MFKISLKEARELSGYTINEVADVCKVSTEVMEKLEEEPELMSARVVVGLRKIYGIPIDYVVMFSLFIGINWA